MATKVMRFCDLFAGIGGTRLGFELACKDERVKPKCVFSCEINEKAAGVYQHQFGDDPLGDVTKVSQDPQSVPDIDVMLAGFPCQAFSRAGKQQGFNDIRGTLFFHLAEIVKAKRPSAFLFENVFDLPVHDGGRTFQVILDVLEKRLGYGVRHRILNSRNFGVPQNRPRIYIVGFDKRFGGGFAFPDPTPEERLTCFADVEEKEPVDAFYYVNQKYFDWMKRHRERHEKKGGQFGYRIIPRDSYAKALACGGMGRERNLVHDERQTDFTKRPKACRERLRMMTPGECERLQGYPTGWTEFAAGGKHQSATARWRQLGNSVTVPVIRRISRNIVRELTHPREFTGDWCGGDLFS